MTDFTRIISISSLVFLSFFCFQMGIFLCSGHKINNNSRRTLILLEFFTGFLLLFDALAYIFRGNTSELGWHMVRLSNFLVFVSNCLPDVGENFAADMVLPGLAVRHDALVGGNDRDA